MSSTQIELVIRWSVGALYVVKTVEDPVPIPVERPCEWENEKYECGFDNKEMMKGNILLIKGGKAED